MPCKLSVAFPELVEGEVHAAVVDQVSGNGQRVSLGNAIMQEALTENYHDPLPVTARYLRVAGSTQQNIKRKSSVTTVKEVETGGSKWKHPDMKTMAQLQLCA